jgi:dTDP-4-dehydrorhamnose reductase
VFDGAKTSYVEEDAVSPLNVYSRSKARAEDALRELVPAHHIIVRTGWVYGPDNERRNFVLRLVDRIARGEKIAVPSDQWGSPTYTEDIAASTRFLIDHGAVGTFHATGPDFLDRAALAGKICEHFGLDARAIDPQPSRALRQTARRSLRVLLDCQKLHNTGAPPFRGVSDGLRSLDAWVRRPLTT